MRHRRSTIHSCSQLTFDYVSGRPVWPEGYAFICDTFTVHKTGSRIGARRNVCGVCAIAMALCRSDDEVLEVADRLFGVRSNGFEGAELAVLARELGARLAHGVIPSVFYNRVVVPEGQATCVPTVSLMLELAPENWNGTMAYLMFVPGPSTGSTGHWAVGVPIGPLCACTEPGEMTGVGAGGAETNNFPLLTTLEQMSSSTRMSSIINLELEKLGFTPDSAAWAAKALYPPSSTTRVGLPINSTEDSVALDYRTVQVLAAPAGLPANTTWDCMVLAPPHDGMPVLAVVGPSPMDFASATTPALGDVIGIDVYGTRAQVPIALRSYTAGTPTVSVINRVPAHLPRGSRHSYKSVTIHMTSSDLYNGGTLSAGQVSMQNCDLGVGFSPDNDTPTAGSGIGIPLGFDVPANETMLTRTCPGAYSSAAKDGVFMPLRITNTDHEYSSGGMLQGRQYIQPGASPTLYWAHLSDNTAANLSTYVDFWAVTTAGRANPWWSQAVNPMILARQLSGLAARGDTATGVVIMRGLHEAATLQLSLYVGFDQTLQPQSSLTPMLARRPYVQPAAFDAYLQIANRLGDAYPASYNSFALIAPLVTKAISAVAPLVKQVLPKVLPTIANAVPIVKDVVDAFRAGESAAEPAPSRREKKKKKPVRSASVASSRGGPRRLVSVARPRSVRIAGRSTSARRK